MEKNQVLVIGAGAAGLAAAYSASENGAQVLILEHTRQAGNKLCLTGAGRCNLTNSDMNVRKYHGDEGFAEKVIGQFSTKDCLDLLHSIGIETKGIRYRYSESLYYYPASEKAHDVRDAFLQAISANGAGLITGANITDITGVKGNFTVRTDRENYRAERIIIASGSNAAPQTGSDSSLYPVLKKIDIPMFPWLPALTPMKSTSELLKVTAGLRMDAKACLIDEDSGVQWEQETGEVQMTGHFISGIPILQLSRYAAIALKQKHSLYLKLKVLSVNNKDGRFPEIPAGLSHLILRNSGNGDGLMLKIPISGVGGFDRAQCCLGGVDCSRIDPFSMEYKDIPGLGFAGEILNVDGDCGGYNLHFAFGTGCIAGRSAAK